MAVCYNAKYFKGYLLDNRQAEKQRDSWFRVPAIALCCHTSSQAVEFSFISIWVIDQVSIDAKYLYL